LLKNRIPVKIITMVARAHVLVVKKIEKPCAQKPHARLMREGLGRQKEKVALV
jgi:hypothetical protein